MNDLALWQWVEDQQLTNEEKHTLLDLLLAWRDGTSTLVEIITPDTDPDAEP